MKKIYNSPEIKIVQLRTHHMIAASQMTFNESAGKSGTVLSRESSNWDDEEDY